MCPAKAIDRSYRSLVGIFISPTCARLVPLPLPPPTIPLIPVLALSYQAVHRRHSNDEGEEVIDHRVQAAVAQESPREMRHALQLVVDVQLRRHQDEPERVHECLSRTSGWMGGGVLILCMAVVV